MPIERGDSIDFDLRKPWWALCVYAYQPLLTCVGCIILLGMVFTGRARYASLCCSFICLSAAACSFSAAGLLLVEPSGARRVEGIAWVLDGMHMLFFTIQMGFFEWFFIQALFCSGVVMMLEEIVFHLALYNHDHCLLTERCNLPANPVLIFCVGVCMYGAKYLGNILSKKMIQKDRQQYDEVWTEICKAQSEYLERLRTLASDLDYLNENNARQFNRLRGVPLAWVVESDRTLMTSATTGETGSVEQQSVDPEIVSVEATSTEASKGLTTDESEHRGSVASVNGQDCLVENGDDSPTLPATHKTTPPGPKRKLRTMLSTRLQGSKYGAKKARGSTANHVDFSSKVTSLDQLCAQATGLDPILRSKIQDWALASNGYFKRATKDNKPDWILWKEARATPEGMASIRWARLKTVGRAIEKLMRSYREDVSRLLDVCRQSIMFESVKDIHDCLQTIMEDPEVEIVRIKNRLDPNYNSFESAGYRDLALNLRIGNHQSAKLGLDTHVCEVQLLLIEVSKIKNDSGHKRYIQFRNLRGQ